MGRTRPGDAVLRPGVIHPRQMAHTRTKWCAEGLRLHAEVEDARSEVALAEALLAEARNRLNRVNTTLHEHLDREPQ